MSCNIEQHKVYEEDYERIKSIDKELEGWNNEFSSGKLRDIEHSESECVAKSLGDSGPIMLSWGIFNIISQIINIILQVAGIADWVQTVYSIMGIANNYEHIFTN